MAEVIGTILALGITAKMVNNMDIGGKTYHPHKVVKTKIEAEKHKKKLKKSGNNVRIKKIKTKGGKHAYVIYKHKRSKK